MYFYRENSRRLTGKRIALGNIFFISSYPLPGLARVVGAEALPKFPSIRKGSIIDHLLVGGRLVRAKLKYLGWNYKLLPMASDDVDFYKGEKIRFLVFQTRAGRIWVRHEVCAFSGETEIIIPRKTTNKIRKDGV